IERAVDLSILPLYVRAGAVLPMGPVKQYSDEPVSGPMTLIVYPGVNGTSSLYEDDGKTFNYRNGEFTKLEMNWSDSDRRLRLRLASGRMLPPASRPFEARVAGQATTHPATFAGRPLDIRL